MAGESQLIFKRRLTLKLNPDFSLMDFGSAGPSVAQATRTIRRGYGEGGKALTRMLRG
jgi:hypothetical protein